MVSVYPNDSTSLTDVKPIGLGEIFAHGATNRADYQPYSQPLARFSAEGNAV